MAEQYDGFTEQERAEWQQMVEAEHAAASQLDPGENAELSDDLPGHQPGEEAASDGDSEAEDASEEGGGEGETAEGGQEEQDPRKQQMVPHQALAEARKEIKELREQNRQFKEQVTEDLKKLAVQQSGQQGAEQAGEEEPWPDKEEDPYGYAERVERELVKEREARQGATTEAETAAYINKLSAWADQRASEIAAEEPAFMDAYQFAWNQAVKAEMDAGFDESVAAERVRGALLQKADELYRANGDVARWILAQARRMGWQPQGGNGTGERAAGEATTTTGEAAQSQNGVPAQGQAPKGKSSDLESIAAGQEASRSLSNAGKATQTDDSLDSFAKNADKMSEKEFLEKWQELSKAGKLGRMR